MCALHELCPSVYILACACRVSPNQHRNLDIVLDLTIHAALIYDDFNYSQLIYDSIVRPFYKNNEDTINNFSKHLEKYFEEKTHQVQSKVSESATDSTYLFIKKSEASWGRFWLGRSTLPTKKRRRRNRRGRRMRKMRKKMIDLCIKLIIIHKSRGRVDYKYGRFD